MNKAVKRRRGVERLPATPTLTLPLPRKREAAEQWDGNESIYGFMAVLLVSLVRALFGD